MLITKQWEEEARKALRRLRASNQVEEDIEEMKAEERAQQAESTISMMELICSPTLRAPLVIGVVMQLSQQLSGINAVSKIIVYKTYIYTRSRIYTYTHIYLVANERKRTDAKFLRVPGILLLHESVH